MNTTIAQKSKWNAYQLTARSKPHLKRCDCGAQAALYRSAAFQCPRCAELESRSVRAELLGRVLNAEVRIKPETVAPEMERHEQKWQRAAGEWENPTGPGWGSLAALETKLAALTPQLAGI